MKKHLVKQLYFTLSILLVMSCTSTSNLGILEAHGDIGNTKQQGAFKFNPSDSTYTISGGGTNMWANKDEFHYAWKKISGNVSIAANIDWKSTGGDVHKKACLIIRQSLEENSVYANVAIHGNGLTSIQYRDIKGGDTKEIQANIVAPKRVRLEKEGDYIRLDILDKNNKYITSTSRLKLSFSEPFYIGIGVCSHNNDIVETAVFSKLAINNLKITPDSLKTIESTLETIDIASLNRRVVLNIPKHIEAPNWSPDGKILIYNSGGLLYKIPSKGGESKLIPTDFAKRINNDHGISPDGTQLVISDQTETGNSIIYSLPIDGGVPKKVTPLSPSYWHGWSPDGKTLAYCAERNGNYDIYTIPFEGGKETRLTTADGLDDGPDYSPDGKYIYFNSVRSGTMQIWRMLANGSQQEQITTDKYNDWFAHPSPDGKWIVYITFNTDVPAGAHPAEKEVKLRLMNLETKEITVITELFGGQGTINVPSWSPDSEKIAFVSYRLK